MTVFQSLVLGIIQGLTEFIPVSSTAHLLIGQKLFNIPATDSMFAFLVLVQMGTLLSLIVYFWKDGLAILQDMFRRPVTINHRLGWHIVLATIPALVAGILLKSAVETLFQTPLLEASIRLLLSALLLFLAERLGKRLRTLESQNWMDALFIGFMQILAIFPGASRSGTTIGGGMFRGFDRPSAARFAFLMSVPVMLAAGGYEMLAVLRMPHLLEFLPVLAVGFISAMLVGWMAIKWLMNFLSRRSLYAFAAYCALAGAACLILYFAGKNLI